jgi:quercetin dioxygenase-like cupin family protein
MKKLRLALVLAALPVAASAQDPVKVDPAHYKVLIDNASVRVLKISYAPGSKSPMHAHPDTVVVPLADAKATFGLPDGKTQDVDLKKDTATFSPAGLHAPVAGATGVDAILVEFKAKDPGTAILPSSRAGMQTTVLAESPRGVAIKTVAAPDFAEPAHSKHDYDQVVIALGPANLSLTVGTSHITSWKRGDVQFIGRGVEHESKNTSGKPIEFVIVAIK